MSKKKCNSNPASPQPSPQGREQKVSPCGGRTLNMSACDNLTSVNKGVPLGLEEATLEDLQKEIDELKDKYLRSVAEFDNYRKHTLKEKSELILNGGEKTIIALLPVLDDMERAIANNDKSDDIEAIKEGMKLICQKFMKTLEGMGVKKIETEDKDFDTEFHNAIAMLPMGEDKKGKVIDCTKAGYTMNDKVIRHADVAVGE